MNNVINNYIDAHIDYFIINYAQFSRHFLIVEFNTLSLYNYQGRLLGTPRWKGCTEESLYTPCISLCTDTLVIRNQSNEKCKIYIYVYNHCPKCLLTNFFHENF